MITLPKGYLGDVEYAILETSGQVTVIQKPEKRTTIPEDFQIQPEYEGIPYDLVVDGKVMEENLQALGKNYAWLKKQVEKFKPKKYQKNNEKMLKIIEDFIEDC